jgi:hypothetical protein
VCSDDLSKCDASFLEPTRANPFISCYMADFERIVRAEAMSVPRLVSFIDLMGTLVNMAKKDNGSGLRGKKYGVLTVMPELMHS